MPVLKPSRHYLAMLDIKEIVRKWQDLEMGERTALDKIGAICIEQQKQDWQDDHRG